MQSSILSVYIAEIYNYQLLTREEEARLACEIQAGSETAYEKLIKSNLRLVVSIAEHYTKNPEMFMDLIQEGNMGLMIAARKFKAAYKTRFSTYAYAWITQYMLRYIDRANDFVHIPTKKKEFMKCVEKAKKILSNQNSSCPTTEQVANFLCTTEDKIKEAASFNIPVSSIDAFVDENNHISISELVASNEKTPEEKYVYHETRGEIFKLLQSLPTSERTVIYFRYNFDGRDKGYSLRDVSDMVGMSPESIRTMEKRALKRMRAVAENKYGMYMFA